MLEFNQNNTISFDYSFDYIETNRFNMLYAWIL